VNAGGATSDRSRPDDHLGYAPAYHLARLHRASGTLPWCVAIGLVIGWLVFLPPLGANRPIANFGVLLASLLLLLPWSVAMSKSAWRLTDRWPEPSRSGTLTGLLRVLVVVAPLAALGYGVLLSAVRLGLPPTVADPNRSIASIAWQAMPIPSLFVVSLGVLAWIVLWLRAGALTRRAAIGRRGSSLARLRVGIGLLAGIVGVLALVALDLVVRRRFGVTDFVATLVLLVAGLLGVLFAWTFGSLHARLSVLIGTIERAEDELRREERNRKGVLPGDPSMNEASSRPEPEPKLPDDEIGPIGGHPDPPGL
jgi:hypothetical protein